MHILLRTIAAAALLLIQARAVEAGDEVLRDKRVLSLAGAREVVAAAEAEARRRGVGVVIAVVDDAGHVIQLTRMDTAQVASVNVGIGKARTAAIYRRPSREFEEQIRNGRVAALALADATPLQGGVPLVVDGAVVGAVGVSGDTPMVDEAIALAGAAAIGRRRPLPTVSHWKAPEVAAAFARGAVLLGSDANRNYMVHASHRERAGLAEVHELDTDIIYVLEGAATLVTGGTVVDARLAEPHEIRGTAVQGGDVRQLSPGDVVIVPNGTPHWFEHVTSPFNYYVVKVR